MAKKRGSNTGIPGLSFSWKRATGLTRARQQWARQTGIPTTKSGLERKIGRMATKGCLGVIAIWIAAAGAVVAIIMN